MKYVVLIISFFILCTFTGLSYWSSFAVILWCWYVWDLFTKVTHSIAFREFILVLYGLNYLLAPVISYQQAANLLNYRMKIPEDEYFALAIPAMLCLQLGLYAIKTKVFSYNFNTARIQTLLNQSLLTQWLIIGIVLRLINIMIPGEISFFFYLFSGIRFVAAFGLFALDRKKYVWHIVAVLAVEVVFSLQQGMFHDMVMWMAFFVLFWLFIAKPNKKQRILIGVASVFLLYLLQVSKADYRDKTWSGKEEAGIEAFQNAINENINSKEGLFSVENFTSSISRVNQAWIFASTVNKMNRTQDFQQLTIVRQYAEAALLPRFIAPDKLRAGDKEIFNKFSGHRISIGTSMGLGIFADGYIAYGSIGVFIFAFALGLIFAGIFKIVEGWAKISPFFVLFMFPILNYAVRPDCDTQTILGHIIKSLLVFSLLMIYFKGFFERNTILIERSKAQHQPDMYQHQHEPNFN